jgi:hypothetical protein
VASGHAITSRGADDVGQARARVGPLDRDSWSWFAAVQDCPAVGGPEISCVEGRLIYLVAHRHAGF